MSIEIDNEFRSLIPPLTDEERSQLEENLKRDGCIDPLVVWDMPPATCTEGDDCGHTVFEWREWKHDIDEYLPYEERWHCEKCGECDYDDHIVLLDGHNRHEICERLNIDYDITRLHFNNRNEAIEWIIQHQLGRRNLQPFQRVELALRLEKVIAERAKEKQKAGGEEKVRQISDEPISTKHELAAIAGVSHDTIHKAKVIANEATPEVKAALRAGEVSINRAYRDLRPASDAARDIGTGYPRPAQPAPAEVSEAEEPEEDDEPGEDGDAAEDETEATATLKMAVHYSSDSVEWYTPTSIIERTLKTLGEIDLDPCSNSIGEPNIPATERFTAHDDGLSRKWKGRVYMNPPYGREIVEWVEKLVQEFGDGNVTEAIALVPARTDTEWCAMMRAFPRCFIRGRLNFSRHENAAPFPSMVIYLGKHVDAFADAFGDIGDTYQLVES